VWFTIIRKDKGMEFGKLNYASGIQPFLYCVLIIATHCNQQLLSATFIVQWQ